MAVNWLRRTVLAAACTSAALLAACGSSSIESALKPARFVAFGDGFSDVGQVGGKRYTVNDGTVNNWTQQVAATYGVTLTPASAGGSSYAQGNARISARPDMNKPMGSADQRTRFISATEEALKLANMVSMEGAVWAKASEGAASSAPRTNRRTMGFMPGATARKGLSHTVSTGPAS